MSTKSKILVVDDSTDFHAMMNLLFKNMEVEVDSVYDGEDCLEKNITEYDVIILDKEMPNLDGIETLKKIREMDTEVFVIGNSALRDWEIKQEFLKYGANAYIEKNGQLSPYKEILKDFM